MWLTWPNTFTSKPIKPWRRVTANIFLQSRKHDYTEISLIRTDFASEQWAARSDILEIYWLRVIRLFNMFKNIIYSRCHRPCKCHCVTVFGICRISRLNPSVLFNVYLLLQAVNQTPSLEIIKIIHVCPFTTTLIWIYEPLQSRLPLTPSKGRTGFSTCATADQAEEEQSVSQLESIHLCPPAREMFVIPINPIHSTVTDETCTSCWHIVRGNVMTGIQPSLTQCC